MFAKVMMKNQVSLCCWCWTLVLVDYLHLFPCRCNVKLLLL